MTANHVDQTITAICTDLDNTPWAKLGRGILAARARDLTGSLVPDGFPTGTLGDGGSRATATSTTTERAALALLPAEDGTPARARHDEHHELTVAAIADLLELERTKQRLVRTLKRIDEIALKPAEAYIAPTCAEPNCEDLATGGRRGRCDPCRKWLEREAKRRGCDVVELGPVPASVIDARTSGRVRTSGPAASLI